jgi:hypothetical protein
MLKSSNIAYRVMPCGFKNSSSPCNFRVIQICQFYSLYFSKIKVTSLKKKERPFFIINLKLFALINKKNHMK